MAIQVKANERKVLDGPGILDTRIDGIFAVDNYETKRRKKASNSQAVLLKKDYQALAVFRYALGKFFRFSELAASKYALYVRQYEALLTICGFPGREEITISEMAQQLQIRYRSAVWLVDRLELERLVIRKKRKVDKFKVFIRITKRGRRVLEKLASLDKQELQRLKPQIRQLSALL